MDGKPNQTETVHDKTESSAGPKQFTTWSELREYNIELRKIGLSSVDEYERHLKVQAELEAKFGKVDIEPTPTPKNPLTWKERNRELQEEYAAKIKSGYYAKEHMEQVQREEAEY